MIDQIPTPVAVARSLVAGCRRRRDVTVIADFAAGDGALLAAAAKYFGEARLAATDVDQRVVRSLRRVHPRWKVGRVDFLDSRSRGNSVVLKNLRGKVDLALLNPPFSCRGGTRVEVWRRGERIEASVAMGFVLQSLEYLAVGGEVRAVLPASVLSSQKDASAREEISRVGELILIGEYGRDAFAGCHPNTVLVAIGRGRERANEVVSVVHSDQRIKAVEIVRGVIPMHEYEPASAKASIRLVHTSDLGEFKLEPQRWIVPQGRIISGPSVLLPRVGQPDYRKVVVHDGDEEFALSDCVFGLRCDTRHHAQRVRSAIRSEWVKFKDLYQGTCAPYLTVGRLAAGLERIGIGVRVPGAFSDQYARSFSYRAL